MFLELYYLKFISITALDEIYIDIIYLDLLVLLIKLLIILSITPEPNINTNIPPEFIFNKYNIKYIEPLFLLLLNLKLINTIPQVLLLINKIELEVNFIAPLVLLLLY